MTRFDPQWHHRPGFGPPWQHKRRFLFGRFARFMGIIAIFFLLGIGGLAFFFTNLFGGDRQTALMVWAAGCGLAFILPLLAGAVAARFFRGIVDPLARLMAAADAVAEGDLSVHLPEMGPGEFGRLTQSFNRMVSELQRADQQRRNLTADVAHELRTPLHIIQGNLEGILDGVYAPTPEHINLLLDETRQLSRLVEDLRTLSLAEAGQLPMQRETVNLADLLKDSATSFSGQAEAAGVSLQVEIDPGCQALQTTGDAGRLDQVLGNLIANALRHTPSGGTIILRLGLSGDEASQEARIQVSDTGEGIPVENLPHIFDRFWRGHSSQAGSGLGLAIARQLVQMQGGRIDAHSSGSGQGSSFTIYLTRN